MWNVLGRFGHDVRGGRFGGGNRDVARKLLRRHRFEFRSVDESEDVLSAAKEKVSLFREYEASRGAVEKLLPEFLFEVRDLTRERRLRDEEPLRGGGETLFPGDFHKRAKCLVVNGEARTLSCQNEALPSVDGRRRRYFAATSTSCHAVKRRSSALKTRATRRSSLPCGVSP